MATLHEMAMKLQESIIQQQGDAHNSVNLNIHRYNNLKLKMLNTINYPHVVVSIGISEAVYNIKDCTKVEGGLGLDEKYVRKWLGKSSVMENLQQIYNSINELGEAEHMQAEDLLEMSEGKAGGVRMSKYNEITAVTLGGLQKLENNIPSEIHDIDKFSADVSNVSPERKIADSDEDEAEE